MHLRYRTVNCQCSVALKTQANDTQSHALASERPQVQPAVAAIAHVQQPFSAASGTTARHGCSIAWRQSARRSSRPSLQSHSVRPRAASGWRHQKRASCSSIAPAPSFCGGGKGCAGTSTSRNLQQSNDAFKCILGCLPDGLHLTLKALQRPDVKGPCHRCVLLACAAASCEHSSPWASTQ